MSRSAGAKHTDRTNNHREETQTARLSRTLGCSHHKITNQVPQPSPVQLRLFKYETGFHSDSSGNIISEIIVKADFDLLFIIRRKEEKKKRTPRVKAIYIIL